jgi:hypothetical protein
LNTTDLDNRLTDGGEVVSLTRGPRSILRKDHSNHLNKTETLYSRNILYRSLQILLFFPSHKEKEAKIKTYKTIYLPVTLFWHETCSLTIWDEHKVKLYDNIVLRRISGSKR